MDQILNPFDEIDPMNKVLKFKKIISNIKDKEILLKISKLLENRLNELNELNELK
tara:strand:+ start:257 stop:421 length:165 start_codon:yes stop_codon:yes gene_type:complete